MDFGDDALAVQEGNEKAAISAALIPPVGCDGRGPLWEDGIPYCRECGEEIPKRRVEVWPKTELCVGCAEEKQRGSKYQ